MKTKSWFIFLVMLLISLTFGCNDVGNDINDSNQDNSSQDNDYNNSNGNEDGNYDNNQSYYSVYFYTESWSEIYMYSWDESGSNASWPGVKMSYDSDGWYKGSVNYANVIFNNNSEQTVDLVSQNGYFVPENKNSEGKYEGKWYSTKPSVSNNYEDDSESDYNDENSSDIDDYLEAPVLVGSHSSKLKTIGLNWDEIENAEKYVVFYNTINDSSSSMKLEEVTTNYTRIKDDGLAGLKIYFWVKAVKDSIYSDFSNCVEIYVSEEEESTDTNNPSEDNGTAEDNNIPSDEQNKATIHFVGANGLGRSSKYSNYTYLGIGYIKQTLWTKVLISKQSITQGIVDGPYKIEPGTYSIKFVTSDGSYNMDGFTEKYDKEKQKWSISSVHDEKSYTFEAGKEYTIYRQMSESNNTKFRTKTFTIKIQEGTD